MPRAFWKGSISFGSVSIPVALVSAESPDELSFHQLDRRDLNPIGYKRVNKKSPAIARRGSRSRKPTWRPSS